MTRGIIDTHIHTWDLKNIRYSWLDGNQTILNRSYFIDDLEPERTKAGITGGVLVQAANSYEDSDYMLGLCDRILWLNGAVCWLPLTNPGETQRALTEKYLRNPYFKGVRHLIHDEADPKWLLQETVLESLNILAEHDIPYDVVGTTTEHVETVLKVADKIPALRMIFDHLNQPSPGRWNELMKEASKHQNFYVKVSGLGTVEDLIKSPIAFCLENFGENRALCGGDWPVSLLKGGYAHTWNVYVRLLEQLLPAQALEKVLSANAIKFYRL